MDTVLSDPITKLASSTWATVRDPTGVSQFDEQTLTKLLVDLYYNYLGGGGGRILSQQGVKLLELSGALEHLLAPTFIAGKATLEHVLLMCAIIHEKGRENADMWSGFGPASSDQEERISGFVARVQTSLFEFALPWSGGGAAAEVAPTSGLVVELTGTDDDGFVDEGDDDREAQGDAEGPDAQQPPAADVAAAAAAAGGAEPPSSSSSSTFASGLSGTAIVGVGEGTGGRSGGVHAAGGGSPAAKYEPPSGLPPPRQPGDRLTYPEAQLLVSTIVRCFSSLEHPVVRKAVLQLVSLPIWQCVTPGVVARELRKYPALGGAWGKVRARAASANHGTSPPTLFQGFAPPTVDAGAQKEPEAPPPTKRPRRSTRRGPKAVAQEEQAPMDKEVASSGANVSASATSSGADAAAAGSREAVSAVRPWLQERMLAGLVRLTVLAVRECDRLLAAADQGEQDEAASGAGASSSSASGQGLSHRAPPIGLCRLVERLMELFVDLLSQYPTRRFSRLLLEDSRVLLAVRGSAFVRSPRGRLTAQLAALLDYYLGFPIDDQTSKPVDPDEAAESHYERLVLMQRLIHSHEHLREQAADLALAAVGPLSRRSVLAKHLETLEDDAVIEVARRLQLLPAPVLARLPPVVKFIGESQDDKPIEAAAGALVAATGGGSAAPLATVSLPAAPSRDLASEVLLDWHRARKSQLQAVNALPLYPTEDLIWDANRVPFTPRPRRDGTSKSVVSTASALALPKLNLQYLTFFDMMLRSFHLYRLEAAYEIRQDLVDAVRRCSPRTVVSKGASGEVRSEVRFDGWSRRAIPLQSFKVNAVGRPKVGQEHPSHVSAELQYDLARYAHHIRREWSQLREHDVVFLVTVRPLPKQKGAGSKAAEEEPSRLHSLGEDVEDLQFPLRWGIRAVRGGEVTAHLDEEGKNFNDPSALAPGSAAPEPRGTKRVLKLRLDPAQYHLDLRDTEKAGEDGNDGAASAYSEFNLIVRRDAKENNFRAVLESLRDIMNAHALGQGVPSWLQRLLLGYGDPGAATPSRLPGHPKVIDVGDTFLNGAHARQCLSTSSVEPRIVDSLGKEVAAGSPDEVAMQPPFRVVSDGEAVTVRQQRQPAAGPYPTDEPPKNPVPFTPTQVRAIRSGLCPGVTLVVGPPGTGKSDVAVQIVSTLYRTRPAERVLLVTHSNQALNDLFQKIAGRDVDGRHLLRLGRGERDLDSDEDFSKWGRVDEALRRRHMILNKIGRLAVSLDLGVPGPDGAVRAPEYTCETAEYFRLQHVQARLELFWGEVERLRAARRTGEGTELREEDAAARLFDAFPFKKYFADVPRGLHASKGAAQGGGSAASSSSEAPLSEMQQSAPLFGGHSFETDLEAARSCERHLSKLFEELRSYRAFELLRSQRQRTDYMLVKEARVVAMTCTHAALTRRHLLKLGFEYDTIVMEEAAQVLEAETLLPMFMQASQRHGSSGFEAASGEPGRTSRLKRVVLIGDHHQLPPVIKCRPLQRYSRLDQSLFARMVRLGFPYIMLESQGRARPSIAETYSWRYGGLAPLPRVLSGPYLFANAGFCHTSQFVDVQDFMGQGESTPTPYFYQNLGEAEFIVATFQYMRLLGYPADRITMLSTYNGQVALLRDIVAKRCSPYPQFGEPRKIETVDKYQGQQNDVILLSLVRTRAVGHVRDVRRLVVALSRARLGLYVFGRQELFESCVEIGPALNMLLQRPSVLQLLPVESWPTTRPEASTGLQGVGTDASPMSADSAAAGSGAGQSVSATEARNATEMGLIVHTLNIKKQEEAAAAIERARASLVAGPVDAGAAGGGGGDKSTQAMTD